MSSDVLFSLLTTFIQHPPAPWNNIIDLYATEQRPQHWKRNYDTSMASTLKKVERSRENDANGKHLVAPGVLYVIHNPCLLKQNIC